MVCPLLKKEIGKIQAQLKVEMVKNSKVSDGTLPIPIGKKITIVKRTASIVIKRPKVIGKFKEIKVKEVIKRPKIIGKFKEIKAKEVIKRPIITGNNDKRERYVNPITLNYVLRPTYLAALRKIKKKDEELQRKFEEVSQKIERRSMMKSHGFL